MRESAPLRDPLSHRAAATPERRALTAVASGERWTYRELDDEVTATAGRLAARGVERGDHLAVLLETRPAFVRLVHASLRLGAPLVLLNARLTPAELAAQVERSDAVLVVCEADTDARAREAADEVPVVSVDGDLDERAPADVEPVDWTPTDPALLLFTSGTTGRPKAVSLALSNLLASAVASAFRLGVLPEDRWHLCLPMYHMGGLAPVVRSTLYGTEVVLQETGDGFDADRTLAAMREHDPTGVSLVPTMLDRLLDAGALPDSLRFVLLGGAPARDDLLDRCADRGVPVCPTYGMTETASQIATARPAEAAAHVGTVGQPLLGTDVTVLGEGGDPLPPGETGELVVRGPTVMRGYYGDHEATAAAFGEYGLHTGDVGYRDEDGRLWVLNRRTDRIVTGGENVDPGEVVEVLRAHPAVEDAAVVGLPDEEWGERVAALVVGDVDLAALQAHCRERLAGFKCPRTVAFAAELPRTASDTVDREAVRERLRRTD
ncbi:MAG: o-succinylbenzoate--CoA ligase [Haloarculaceae archaeon]